ncbi:MAG: 30S ribosomal protein S6 [Candidatus Cloacimonetes bacterium]|nr:30S ribosomal protein S6 [Candidatus Cloacimonadota bacterium]
MLKNYESMIIFDPALSAETITQLIENIKTHISKQGGEVVSIDDWGKRNLAYEIKGFKEGYYVVNFFNLDPKNIAEYERLLKLDEHVVRFNVLTKT